MRSGKLLRPSVVATTDETRTRIEEPRSRPAGKSNTLTLPEVTRKGTEIPAPNRGSKKKCAQSMTTRPFARQYICRVQDCPLPFLLQRRRLRDGKVVLCQRGGIKKGRFEKRMGDFTRSST